MKRLRHNKKGFSLVELICAVAILAVVIAPLLQAFVTSTKLSRRSVKISEATMAGQNILETIDARPTDEFEEGGDTALPVELLTSSGVTPTITSLGATNKDGSFSTVVSNLKSGNSTFDAKVTFERGDETDPLADGTASKSHGLYIINEKPIAQYANMDAVYSQSNLNATNPDNMFDTYWKSFVASHSDIIESEPFSRTRKLTLTVTKDDNGIVTATLVFKYSYRFKRLTSSSSAALPVNKTYSFALFPGGKEFAADDNVNIYIMYNPFYSDEENSDYIDIINMGKDAKKVNLTVYLYKQALATYPNYAYNCAVRVHDPNIEQSTVENLIPLKDRAMVLYTNASVKADEEIYDPVFSYGVYNVVGYNDYVDDTYIETIDGKLIKTKDTIRIYNIKIELYDHGAYTPATDTTTASFDETKKVYTFNGSKTN